MWISRVIFLLPFLWRQSKSFSLANIVDWNDNKTSLLISSVQEMIKNSSEAKNDEPQREIIPFEDPFFNRRSTGRKTGETCDVFRESRCDHDCRIELRVTREKVKRPRKFTEEICEQKLTCGGSIRRMRSKRGLFWKIKKKAAKKAAKIAAKKAKLGIGRANDDEKDKDEERPTMRRKCEMKPVCRNITKEDPNHLIEYYDYAEKHKEICDVTCTEYLMSKCPNSEANILQKRSFTKTYSS